MKKSVIKLVEFSVDRPKTVIILALILTAIFAYQFPAIHIDTDPENMLSEAEPVRIFHNQVKRDFGINEMIVLGVTREDGIFRQDSLARIKHITDEIMKIKGVISDDLISLSVTNNVVGSEGTLHVRPPLDVLPNSPGDVERIRQEVLDNPLFVDRLVSRDGKGAAIYIPIESKDIAHDVGEQIREILGKLDGPEKFYMAGLPIAEDTFGTEMFRQMGIVAPLAGGLIMVVLYIIFRRLTLTIPIMMVAMLSVIWTMGLMIGLGFTVHIMSSMIPVFLMPIAVCDGVHILSDFYEKYSLSGDRRKTILEVFQELFRPMFFTSVTTAVGFANLAWADIPPVRVFGLFVGFGILAAWLLTMTVVPASLMLIKRRRFNALRNVKRQGAIWLGSMGELSLKYGKLFITAGVVLIAVAVTGVFSLSVNDNPVKWFKKDHPIRVADRELNNIIGGTYISYLTIDGKQDNFIKRPDVMNYMENLQSYLEKLNLVGKTSSVADVVKRVNYVLHDGDRRYSVLPDSGNAIGQYLFLFLMSSAPDELDNFVDYNYRKANIWVQLKSGDNKDMTHVVDETERFLHENPPPAGAEITWSGLPYLNVTWQKLMVKGMLKATIGSWWVIFILLIILFRSFWWGLLSMLPLGFSVLFSYGIIGFAGKEYDMPIAVCSTLALGLGVDFAIHFVERFRHRFSIDHDLQSSMRWTMGGEPALAIFRNALVVGTGFLPLVISTLSPYVTVGLFFGSLAFFSGVTTLIFLPSIIVTFRSLLLKQ